MLPINGILGQEWVVCWGEKIHRKLLALTCIMIEEI